MGAFFTIAVVVAILLAVLWGVFELTPFVHHAERFRDDHGKRVGSSPHLD